MVENQLCIFSGFFFQDSKVNTTFSNVLLNIIVKRLFLRFLFSFFQNVSIGIVGKDMEFVIYDDDDVAPFLEGLEERPQRKVQQGVLGFIKFSLDS